MVGIEDLKNVDINKLLKYLVESGKRLEELTVKELLEILEEQGLIKKPYPEPKPVPPSMSGRKIYMNIYDVEYVADTYEGARIQTYTCYSLDEPITDPKILEEHHKYFYPQHEIISLYPAGHYEKKDIGRAKLVYDPTLNRWIEVE